MPLVFVKGLVDLYLSDKHRLAGTTNGMVGVVSLFPYTGIKTYGWLSHSSGVVRSNYSPVGNTTTHELANADCGDLPFTSAPLPMDNCNVPCPGNPGEFCGGVNALLVSWMSVDVQGK